MLSDPQLKAPATKRCVSFENITFPPTLETKSIPRLRPWHWTSSHLKKKNTRKIKFCAPFLKEKTTIFPAALLLLLFSSQQNNSTRLDRGNRLLKNVFFSLFHNSLCCFVYETKFCFESQTTAFGMVDSVSVMMTTRRYVTKRSDMGVSHHKRCSILLVLISRYRLALDRCQTWPMG